ncbi:MAG TPA: hypothetical protein VF231_07255 [Candidatus Limnocylindrales bacterium]|jgi:hypothetical protein
MIQRRASIFAAVLLALIAFVAGCTPGSGGGASAPAPAATSAPGGGIDY